VIAPEGWLAREQHLLPECVPGRVQIIARQDWRAAGTELHPLISVIASMTTRAFKMIKKTERYHHISLSPEVFRLKLSMGLYPMLCARHQKKSVYPLLDEIDHHY
jgi:hypothetical protein